MKRFLLLILLFTAPFNLLAQRFSEYNKKGDEALIRNDVADAKMWFEEGVTYCDSYSIEKLTTIWIENESVRSSMRSLMIKCFNCLNIQATDNDTTAMTRLITYYEKGIGIPQSPELAEYWKEQLKANTLNNEEKLMSNNTPIEVKTESTPVNLIIGYSYSPSAPYGMTLGLIGKRWGGYIRLKTNMTFGKTSFTCNDNEIINYTDASYYRFDKKQVSRFGVTGGLVLRFLPWLYTSFGVGYGERELQWHATAYSYSDNNNRSEFWCENTSSSYKGIETEADVIVRVWKKLYFNVGFNSINLGFVDLNTGLGFVF